MDKLPTTIEECHEVIRLLLSKLDVLSKQVRALEVECAQLKERLNINSLNSSLPPSKSLKKKTNNREPSGKKSGGQLGHKGYHRELLPTDEVDAIMLCRLPLRCGCGGKIKLDDEVVRHQVHELPTLKLDVTEYQLQKGRCEDCHTRQMAELPEGITCGITGPKLTAFMADLVTKYGLSRREQRSFLEEHFQFRISLGTVFNKQKIVNAALAAPVSGLLPLIKENIAVHADETGHNRDGKKHWMWGFMSETAAYFSIQASRGKKVFRFMMGDFKNILITDRASIYNDVESYRRQICWAHLKRNFQKLSEKNDAVVARIGKKLLENVSQLFQIWHEFKSQKITRDELIRQLEPLRRRVGELLEQGTYTDPTLKAARLCKNVLRKFDSLWVFSEVEGVEPTNNHAERCLRPPVIWRKKYFCTRSDYGTDFVARSAAIHATCKLQGKSSFKFLCTLLQNDFSGFNTSTASLMV